MSAFHQPRLNPVRAAEAKKRKCLSCGDTFDSKWSGDRICRKCKMTEGWHDGEMEFDCEVIRA